MKKSVDRKSLFLGREGPGYDFRAVVQTLKDHVVIIIVPCPDVFVRKKESRF